MKVHMTGPNLPPEVELLLCCARTQMDAKSAGRLLHLTAGEIDWGVVDRLARHHRLVPLLHRNLKATAAHAVPDDVLRQFQARFTTIAHRNLRWTGELLRIIALFEAHEIPAIPYKGPALAALLYGSLVLRQFRDLDLLVREEDALRAQDLLLDGSYRSQFDFDGVPQELLLRNRHHFNLLHADDALVVELHYRILAHVHDFRIDLNRLWAGLELLEIAGTTVATFPPEDWLLILCVHGGIHRWKRLHWLCDVAELIRAHPGLGWARVLKRAEALDMRRMFLLGIFLADDLCGAVLPEQIRRATQADRTVPVLGAQIREQFGRDPEADFGTAEFHLYRLRAREHWRDRVRYCLAVVSVATPAEYMALALPSRLSFLYSLFRPIRLAGKYGLRLLRRITPTSRTP
ncbi:MAG: nucleotidyltransferase family protein [Chloroflexi bacterium]|nr:nucleotidyltransferase family protein [Chloroflexota bacterium]